ncbi:MAG: four helix bundle protein [Prevotellaceae bacterium]|jgi:four helix bundle protein|nr:four helix bundle protein [Prevotellaceae bacterium]
MKENLMLDKTFEFAVRIVNLYKQLTTDKKEFVMSKQILRSGTSMGANSEEANSGQSKKDFIAKLEIVLKEAKETRYWLRLLNKTEYIDSKIFESMLADCTEIIAIVTAIILTTRKNINSSNNDNNNNTANEK